jgi:SHS2 domain-containing protein
MAGHRGESGHELLPHTADVVVSAWGPTAERCYAEAVRGLVACFADVRHARPDRAVPFNCDPGADSELLVQLLEEVIYLVDVHDVVPVLAAVARTPHGGLVGEFGVVTLSSVDLIGPAPKAISRHGLRFARDGGGWRCAAVVDV